MSLTSDFGSLLREALRAILSGNQPFNLDQKIHVFWTTFSRCKCFQGKQDNEAYPNSEKSGNFLTLANPKGFFQWSNPPNSEKSSENSKIPKKKMGFFGKWVFHASFWVSRNGTRALHDTNRAKARRCSYRVNLDTKKPPSWALLEKDDYGHYGCSQLMWHPQKKTA